MDLDKYRKIFIDETSEDLNSLEILLLHIEKQLSDPGTLNSIFRLFHRLKSSSAMMGLNCFSEISHHAEDILSLIREGKIENGDSIVETLLSVIDVMRRLLRESESGDIEGYRPEELLVRLEEICDATHHKPAASPDRHGLTPSFPEVSSSQIQHGLEVIRIGESDLNDLIDMAGDLISTITELDRVAHLLNGIQLPKEAQFASQNINSIKRKAEQLSLSIHARLLCSKMVPAGEVFERLRRVIHDLSVKTNKRVQVITHGNEIELDRGIADKLFNPLLHVVRNAVDHGLESDEERIKKGKPDVSTITLTASLEGHNVNISVIDDGKGVDLERARSVILKRGIRGEEEVKNMTKKEVLNCLFLPGFSTKEEATEISGRGIGLDIVRGNAEDLKGRVEISSEKGCGTHLKITIPQTLAVIRSLQVIIGGNSYSIPTESIIEIVPYNPTSLMAIRGKPLLIYRGSPVPIADLYEMLTIRCNKTPVSSCVIIGKGDLKVVIPVNNIIGEQDLLLKHLGQSFSNVMGILGVGVLGGARLSLIVDTDFILRQYVLRESIHETAKSE